MYQEPIEIGRGHIAFTGDARSGKTPALMRLVADMYPSEEDSRFIILDHRNQWRAMRDLTAAEDFQFHTFVRNDDFSVPLKLNLCAIPEGVSMEDFTHILTESFLTFFSMPEQYTTHAAMILGNTLKTLYRTKPICSVTFMDVLIELKRRQEKSPQNANVFRRLIDRISYLASSAFCWPDGVDIGHLLNARRVLVLEAYGHDMQTTGFLFSMILKGIVAVRTTYPQKPHPPLTMVIDQESHIFEDQNNCEMLSRGRRADIQVLYTEQGPHHIHTDAWANTETVFAGRSQYPPSMRCVERRSSGRASAEQLTQLETGEFFVIERRQTGRAHVEFPSVDLPYTADLNRFGWR